MDKTSKIAAASVVAASTLATAPIAQAKDKPEMETGDKVRIEQVVQTPEKKDDKTLLEKGADGISTGFRWLMNGAKNVALWPVRKVVNMGTGVVEETGEIIGGVGDKVGDKYVAPVLKSGLQETAKAANVTAHSALNIAEDTFDAATDLTGRTIEATGQVASGKVEKGARNVAGATVKDASEITGSAIVNASETFARTVEAGSNVISDALTDLVERPIIEGAADVTAATVKKKMGNNKEAEQVIDSAHTIAKKTPDVAKVAKRAVHAYVATTTGMLGQATGESVSMTGNVMDAAIRGDGEKVLKKLEPAVEAMRETTEKDLKEISDEVQDFSDRAKKIVENPEGIVKNPEKTVKDITNLVRDAHETVEENGLKMRLKALGVSSVVKEANEEARQGNKEVNNAIINEKINAGSR